jgi:hypothetical protein
MATNKDSLSRHGCDSKIQFLDISPTESFLLFDGDLGTLRSVPPAPPSFADNPKVNVDVFLDRMIRLWEARSNTTSPGLITEWATLCAAFSASISDSTTGSVYTYNGTCGIGKSQAAQIAMAVLASTYFSASYTKVDKSWGGILVVERIEAANEAVAVINDTFRAITGYEDDCAIAKHSQNEVTYAEIQDYPILVITHQAYSNSLQRLHDGDKTTFHGFTRWNHGQRRLVIVDESINPINSFSLKLDQYRKVHGFIIQAGLLQAVKKDFPNEWAAFKSIGEYLELVDQSLEKPEITTDRLNSLLLDAGDEVDMSKLYDALLRDADWGRAASVRSRENALLRAEVREVIRQTLRAIDRFLIDWSYASKSGKVKSTHSSQWLLSDDVSSLVILDGTSSHDLIYRLFPKRIEIPSNKELRSFKNVNLHLKHTKAGLGKSSFERIDDRSTKAHELMDWLRENMNPNHRVLVVAHQDFANCLIDLHNQNPYFTEFDTTHWGNTTGKNTWNQFDTVVIASCFYRPREWAINSIAAQSGINPQILSQLNSKDKKTLASRLITSKVAVDTIQALFRSRIRHVIDEVGNCDRADLFVLLPEDRDNQSDGTDIRQSIIDELPGAKVLEWDFNGYDRKRRPRPDTSLRETEILNQLRLIAPGSRVSVRDFHTGLQITKQNWSKTWQPKLTDPDHPIGQEAKRLGISLKPEGYGRARKVWLQASGQPQEEQLW